MSARRLCGLGAHGRLPPFVALPSPRCHAGGLDGADHLDSLAQELLICGELSDRRQRIVPLEEEHDVLVAQVDGVTIEAGLLWIERWAFGEAFLQVLSFLGVEVGAECDAGAHVPVLLARVGNSCVGPH